MLSQARADAVKAFLEQDVDAWLAFYDEQGATKWGSREDRLMIRSLPDFAKRLTEGETSSDGTSGAGAASSTKISNRTTSSDSAQDANGAASNGATSNGAESGGTGASNGPNSKPKKPESRRPETIVEWFQRTRGLEVDDIAGPETRRALISEYMGVGTVNLRETPGYPVSIATLGEGEDYPLAETGLPLDVKVSGGNASGGSGAGGVSEAGAVPGITARR